MRRTPRGACEAVALIGAVPKGSGAKMCVLTPAAFAAAGIPGTSQPTINVDDGGNSAYCVYRGKSGATGGVEFDVFYPAGAAATDVEQTFKTVLGSDPGGRYDLESVPGSSESVYLPPNAKSQFQRLSRLVLERL